MVDTSVIHLELAEWVEPIDIAPTAISTLASATERGLTIVPREATVPNNNTMATDSASISETESELYHKRDICSKAFFLDLSDVVEEDSDGQQPAMQGIADQNRWATLAPSFGKDGDRFIRYRSDKTLGTAWLRNGKDLCTFCPDWQKYRKWTNEQR